MRFLSVNLHERKYIHFYYLENDENLMPVLTQEKHAHR